MARERKHAVAVTLLAVLVILACTVAITDVYNTNDVVDVAYAEGESGTVTYEARVTTSAGVSTEYTTFASALSAMQSGDTLTLLSNVGISQNMGVSNTVNNIVVDIAGFTISTNDSNLFIYFQGTNITIKDSSSAKTGAFNIALNLYNNSCVFDGVKCNKAISCSGDYIYFKNSEFGSIYLSNNYANCRIENCTVGHLYSGGVDATEAVYNAVLPAGYVYQAKNSNTILDPSQITGSFKVVECSHTWNDGVCKVCKLACGHSFNASGKCTTCQIQAVAKVDKGSEVKYYLNFGNALSALENGDTIVLLANVSISESTTITQNITFDLNGKTISSSGEFTWTLFLNGKTTIKDSSADKTGVCDVWIYLGSNFTLGENEEYGNFIEGGTFNEYVSLNKNTIVTGGKFTGVGANGENVRIEGGTFNGTINESNNSIEACFSVDIESVLTIAGGEFNSTVSVNASPSSVHITGGKFKTFSVEIYDETEVMDVQISGGEFESIELDSRYSYAEFIKAGYLYTDLDSGSVLSASDIDSSKKLKVVECTSHSFDTNGKCTACLLQTVATVDHGASIERYYDFDSALSALQNGDTMTLFVDVTIEEDMLLNKNVTINLVTNTLSVTNKGTISDGTFNCTLTNSSSGTISGGTFSGEVTNNGTISGGTFKNTVVNNSGCTISGGTFSETSSVTNNGTISNGAFSGSLINTGKIDAGTFNLSSLKNARGEDDNLGIYGGTFNISGEMLNDGDIRGGTFTVASTGSFTNGLSATAIIWDGDFTLNVDIVNSGGAIGDGTFKKGDDADRIVLRNSAGIHGGTFTVSTIVIEDEQSSQIFGGTFSVSESFTIKGYIWCNYETDIVINANGDVTNATKITLGNKNFIVNNKNATNPITFINNNEIQGGEFNCKVNNVGTINGGKYTGSVTNNGTINGGTYSGEVTNNATISSGTYDSSVINGNAGTIASGTFSETSSVTNNGTIAGGAYTGSVTNYGTINGGTFNGTVNNLYTTVDGVKTLAVIDKLDDDNKPVFGLESTVNNSGEIKDGSFSGTIANNGTISSGTFSGAVTNDGTISGGTFNGTIANNEDGEISGGSIRLENDFVNNGTLTGTVSLVLSSTATEAVTITNNGTIAGSTYSLAIANNGTISSGTFNGDVTNNSGATISNGIFNGDVTNNSGATISAGELHKTLCNYGNSSGCLMNDAVAYNYGEMKGGSFIDAVDAFVYNYRGGVILAGNFTCKIENEGTISGGMFTHSGGSETAPDILNKQGGLIEGGVHSGFIVNYGTFKNGVYPNGDSREIKCESGVVNNGSVINGTYSGSFANNGSVQGGTFDGTVTNNGTISGGTFNGTIANNEDGEISGGSISLRYSFVNNGTLTGTVSFDTSAATEAVTITNNGTIAGSTYSLSITNNGTITGGTFSREVTNNATITGGTFSGTVENRFKLVDSTIVKAIIKSASDGTLPKFTSTVENVGIIENGKFEGSVMNTTHYNISNTVEQSYGEIKDGVFTGSLINRKGNDNDNGTILISMIEGGTFNLSGSFTNSGDVVGGTFTLSENMENTGAIARSASFAKSDSAGDIAIVNKGLIAGGTFNIVINNQSVYDSHEEWWVLATISNGTFEDVVHNYGGIILSGTFNGTVSNSDKTDQGELATGEIRGGIYKGSVTNNGIIKGGTFASDVINSALITASVEYQHPVFNGAVFNSGTISGGTFKNTVLNEETGTIDKNGDYIPAFNDQVENDGGTINNGTFEGMVVNNSTTAKKGTINGGTFNGGVSDGGVLNGVQNYGVINGGTFNVVGNTDTGEVYGGTFNGSLSNSGIVKSVDGKTLKFAGEFSNQTSGKVIDLTDESVFASGVTMSNYGSIENCTIYVPVRIGSISSQPVEIQGSTFKNTVSILPLVDNLHIHDCTFEGAVTVASTNVFGKDCKFVSSVSIAENSNIGNVALTLKSEHAFSKEVEGNLVVQNAFAVTTLSGVVTKEHTHTVSSATGLCDCGYECPHTDKSNDGICSACGYQYGVKIDAYTSISFAKDLASAVSACHNGDTLIILRDIENTQNVTIDKSVTIDFNGKNVTGSDISANGNFSETGLNSVQIVFKNSGSAGKVNVTIHTRANVTIQSGSYKEIDAVQGSITITGGDFEKVAADMLSVTISGGNITELYVYYFRVKLSGGSFGSISLSGVTYANILEDDYAFELDWEGETTFVKLSEMDSSKKVIVSQCTNHAWTSGVCDYCAHACEHSGGTATCKTQAKCTTCGEDYGSLDADNHENTEAEWSTKTADKHAKTWGCCGVVVVAEENHEWSNGTCTECGYNCVHEGGEATCTEKATCSHCGSKYGSLDADNHENTEAEWSTKTADKHAKTWGCCGMVVVAEENHEWSNGTCTECEYVCVHEGGEATCTEKATCSHCGSKYGSLDADNHENTEAEWSTKTADKHAKTWGCCGMVVVAEENHEWSNGTCTECEYNCVHDGGEATCTEKATCSHCGEKYGNLAEHTYDVVKYSGTEHWMECSCGAEKPNSREDHHGGVATCKDKALCDDCEQYYGSLAEHDFGTWVIEVPAQCEETGTKGHKDCSVCEKHFDNDGIEITDLTINALGHNQEGSVDHKDAKCTETGVVGGMYCTRCNDGKSAAEATIPALGHNQEGSIAHVDAKCTEAGVVGGMYCTRCNDGKSAAEATINALGHDQKGSIAHVDAKCTETGVVGGTYCTRCNDGKDAANATIPALGHNQEGSVDHKDAKCTETGVVGGTYCTRCNDGKSAAEATINALGHDQKGSIAHVDAKCTETGVVGGTYCTRCNDGKDAANATIPALGHNQEGSVDHKDAKCTETGVVGGTYCTRCDDGKDAANATIPALGHNQDGSIAHKDAKCTETGVVGGMYCTRCNDGKADAEATIPALGHSGGKATCVGKAECSACGKEYGDIDAHNHASLTEIAPVAPSVISEGNTAHFYCSACDKLYSDSEASNEISKESVVIAKLAPSITQDSDVEFVKNGDKGFVIKSDALRSDFRRLLVDGEEVDKDNYHLGENGLEIIFKTEYLVTLTEGEHTVAIECANGTAESVFTILPAVIPEDVLTPGEIAGIVIASMFFAGVCTFAVVWFVIKKKNFNDMVNAVKALRYKLKNNKK